MSFTPHSDFAIEEIIPTYEIVYGADPFFGGSVHWADINFTWVNPVAAPLDRGWAVVYQEYVDGVRVNPSSSSGGIGWGFVSGWAGPQTSYTVRLNLEVDATQVVVLRLASKYLGFVQQPSEPSYNTSLTIYDELTLTAVRPEPPAPPANTPPSDLAVTDDDIDFCTRLIDLSWIRATDGGGFYTWVYATQSWTLAAPPGNLSSRIEVSTDPDFPPDATTVISLGATISTYADLALEPVLTYYIRIEGGGLYSNTLTITGLTEAEFSITYAFTMPNWTSDQLDLMQANDSLFLAISHDGPSLEQTPPVPSSITFPGMTWTFLDNVPLSNIQWSLWHAFVPTDDWDPTSDTGVMNIFYSRQGISYDVVWVRADPVSPVVQTSTAAEENGFVAHVMPAFSNSQNLALAFLDAAGFNLINSGSEAESQGWLTELTAGSQISVIHDFFYRRGYGLIEWNLDGATFPWWRLITVEVKL